MTRLVLIYCMGLLSNTLPGYGNSNSYGRTRGGHSKGGKSGSDTNKDGGGGPWWFDAGQSQSRGGGSDRDRDGADEGENRGSFGGRGTTNNRFVEPKANKGGRGEKSDGDDGYGSSGVGQGGYGGNGDGRGGNRGSGYGRDDNNDSSHDWAVSQDKLTDSHNGRGYDGYGSKDRERYEDSYNGRGDSSDNHGGREYSGNDHENNSKYGNRGSSGNSNGKDGGGGPWWFDGGKRDPSSDNSYTVYKGNGSGDKDNKGAWWFNGGYNSQGSHKISTTQHESNKYWKKSEKYRTRASLTIDYVKSKEDSLEFTKQNTRSIATVDVATSGYSNSEEREGIPDGLKQKFSEIIIDHSGSSERDNMNDLGRKKKADGIARDYIKSNNRSSIESTDDNEGSNESARSASGARLGDDNDSSRHEKNVEGLEGTGERDGNTDDHTGEANAVVGDTDSSTNLDGWESSGGLAGISKTGGRAGDHGGNSDHSDISNDYTSDYSESRDDIATSGERNDDRSGHEKKKRDLQNSYESIDSTIYRDSVEKAGGTVGFTWDSDYEESRRASRESITRGKINGKDEEGFGNPRHRSKPDFVVDIIDSKESGNISAVGDSFLKLVEKFG